MKMCSDSSRALKDAGEGGDQVKLISLHMFRN